ncbi:MAG: hypothetical protein U9O66_03955, partial [Patescibacteria group bacterium]|nr:hypothetical protein [Patescibacteria group bacterium]
YFGQIFHPPSRERGDEIFASKSENLAEFIPYSLRGNLLCDKSIIVILNLVHELPADCLALRQAGLSFIPLVKGLLFTVL